MGIKEKSYEIRYLTHMIVFPDGDAFVEQKQFIHDIQFEASNWLHSVFHHQDNAKSLIRDLLKKGECRCHTPYHGSNLTHVYTIEEKERPTGWFGSSQH